MLDTEAKIGNCLMLNVKVTSQYLTANLLLLLFTLEKHHEFTCV